MSVSIEVCKDVEQFQETVAAGMDAKHMVFAIGGIVLGSIVGGVSHILLHLNKLVTMYLVMFTAVPVIFIGFLDKDGMSIVERIKKSRSVRRMGTLYSISTENSEYFESLAKRNLQAQKEETTGTAEPEELRKKFLILVLVGAGAFVLLSAVILFILLRK